MDETPDIAPEHVPAYERGRRRGIHRGLLVAATTLATQALLTHDPQEKAALKRAQALLARKAEGFA